MRRSVLALAGLALVLAACSSDEANEIVTTTTTPAPESTTTLVVEPMSITSPAFDDGAEIPQRYSCDGADINPELVVANFPINAMTAVLIVDDPDAPLGTWTHWVEYDIDVEGDTMTVPEDSGAIGTEGVNSWNLPGYGGPCPPPGETHRYFFKVFALSETLDLPAGADAEGIEQAMVGKIVAEAELMGTFGR